MRAENSAVRIILIKVVLFIVNLQLRLSLLPAAILSQPLSCIRLLKSLNSLLMSTKAELYKLLKANSGRFVSGQEIASRLELSRTAVWKAVRALEEEGFEIESARSQGYRLVSDAYSQLSLSCGLDIPVCFYDEIDSTNNEARRLLSQGTEAPFVVAAVRQTGGKGRRGRSFSEAEAFLLMKAASTCLLSCLQAAVTA